MCRLGSAVLLTALAVSEVVHGWQPMVATREGVVKGLPRRSAAGNTFYSFQGIPYARPPVGALRFKPPQRHTGWSGVLDASAHRDKCMQHNFLKNCSIEGSEDCLFVNIYTPNLPKSPTHGGLPVMVWIHGGGFVFGDGDESVYGPLYFMDSGVILVTFNYRLGPLGFFTTEDANAPGNYGLLDQVLLLKWVRDNIASFGGDPNLVTIFGESAGGASVSLLVLSPLTEGLFHHAISQSGASFNDWSASGKETGLAKQYAERLNCTAKDTAGLLECVRSANATALLGEKDPLNPWVATFKPRVDTESDSPFLPSQPPYLFERGEFNLVPWMIGLTEEECASFAVLTSADKEAMTKLTARDTAAYCNLLQFSTDDCEKVFDCGVDSDVELTKIIDFYTGKHGHVSAENLYPLARLLTDKMMAIPIIEESRLASAHAPVYMYVLDHKGPGRKSVVEVWPTFVVPGPDLGVSHADDIVYLFTNNQTAMPDRDSSSYKMIRFMVDVWTNFARTGTPSSDVFPMPAWPILTSQSQRHMRLNSEPSLGERWLGEELRFWRDVPLNDAWKHPVRTEPCPGARDEL